MEVGKKYKWTGDNSTGRTYICLWFDDKTILFEDIGGGRFLQTAVVMDQWIEVKEKKKGWINIYASPHWEGHSAGGKVFTSKKEAQLNVRQYTGERVLDTVEIEYEV